jgi:hypothetical protein
MHLNFDCHFRYTNFLVHHIMLETGTEQRLTDKTTYNEQQVRPLQLLKKIQAYLVTGC